jgi:hypothetical protein
MRTAIPHLRDPQEIPLCLSCGQHEEWRDGLCSECDCAERNATKADEHDVDAILRETAPARRAA